ncbi:MAG: histidinol-phosphate transaminase [Pseudomonadota bacterium]
MSQKALTPQPGILDIAPYVPGESNLPSGRKPIKLSSNETPLGPSPAAIAAYRDASATLERYPDGQATQLRRAIAEVHGLAADQIICGSGSDEVLSMLAAAYLGPGDEAIYSEHGFLVYRIAILANGATPVIAPETELTTDVDAMLARVSEKTRMVFVANPNNPTGTVLPASEIKRLRAGLPDEVILVLDGAYAEYVEADAYTDGADLVATSNTVMTRTFSKIHGLAALRLGWAYAPKQIIDVLNRIRGPFNVGAPALAAGEAAIRDVEHMQRAIQHNSKWLPILSDEISRMGLTVTPSVANFILFHVPAQSGHDASDLDTFLKSQFILLRRVTGYGLPDAMRMSIGTDAENQTVLEALKHWTARAPLGTAQPDAVTSNAAGHAGQAAE